MIKKCSAGAKVLSIFLMFCMILVMMPATKVSAAMELGDITDFSWTGMCVKVGGVKGAESYDITLSKGSEVLAEKTGIRSAFTEDYTDEIHEAGAGTYTCTLTVHGVSEDRTEKATKSFSSDFAIATPKCPYWNEKTMMCDRVDEQDYETFRVYKDGVKVDECDSYYGEYDCTRIMQKYGAGTYTFDVVAVPVSGNGMNSSKPSVMSDAYYYDVDENLPVPDGLYWDGATPKWNAVEGVRYELHLLKYDEASSSYQVVSEYASSQCVPTLIKENGSGAYIFEVVACLPYGDEGKNESTAVSTSKVFECSNPTRALATPGTITWDDQTAKWDAVSNADSYGVKITGKRNGRVEETFETTTDSTSIDIIETLNYNGRMEGCDEITVQVKALSSLTDWTDSDYSKESTPYVKTAKVILCQPDEKYTFRLNQAPVTLDCLAYYSDEEALKYQWYSNTTNSNVGGKKIPGATHVSYLPSTEQLGTTYYYCVVSDSKGNALETSRVATVTVENRTIGTPTNLRWDGCVAKWDAVEGAETYLIYLYKNGVLDRFLGAYGYHWTFIQSASKGTECDLEKEWLPRSGDGVYTFRVSAIPEGSEEITEEGRLSEMSPALTYPLAEINYQTHIQDIGWEKTWKKDGEMSGTSGQSKRLEAIRINLGDTTTEGSIEYRTHIQNIGWESTWKKDGELSGTSGKAYRLEAIQIRLTGDMAKKYDVYYRVHAQNFGWMGWAKNGEDAGTAGYAYRLEGIRIQLVPKGDPAPGSTKNAYRTPLVSYSTHVQDFGWQANVLDGATSGTVGKAKRLEAIKIQLMSPAYSGNIEYKTHIQNIGWEKIWKKNGQMSGTSGKAYRLEAIQIRLTGEMAQKYDIYYRVHAQNFGWMGWAKNGQSAGTAGFAYRLEGIQIKLVPKGEAAPGSTTNCFRQK